MSHTDQNNHDYSQAVLDNIASTDIPFRGIYLFASEAGDQEARSYMFSQLGALARKLQECGSPVELIDFRDFFEPSGQEYAIKQDAIAALDDNRFYQIDLTEEINLSVHFMKWFSVKGIKLLGMTLPVHKKQIIIATNTEQSSERKFFPLSWLKAEQLIFLSRMVFYAYPDKMVLIRSILHPSGAEIDFDKSQVVNK